MLVTVEAEGSSKKGLERTGKREAFRPLAYVPAQERQTDDSDDRMTV